MLDNSQQVSTSYWRKLTTRWLSVVISLLLVLLVSASGMLQGTDNRFHDIVAGLTIMSVDSDVVLVDIDSQSLKTFNDWPWPRSYYATAIERLAAAGAASIFIDIDFSTASTHKDDKAFADALSRTAVPVYLPVFLQQTQIQNRAVLSMNTPLTMYTEHAGVVSVNLQPDADGLVRHYMTATRFAGNTMPTFASTLNGSSHIGTEVRINYRIDPASVPRLSFHRLLQQGVDAELIRGKHIIIGATALELGDVIPVPVYRSLPGPVVQAMAHLTLANAELIEVDQYTQLAMLFGLALVFGIVAGLSSWRMGMMLGLLLMAALLLGAMLAHARYNMILQPTAACLFLVFSYIGTQLSRLDRKIYTVVKQRLQLIRNELFMTSVVENIGDAVIMLDEQSRLLSMNAAARRMFDTDHEVTLPFIEDCIAELDHAGLQSNTISGESEVSSGINNKMYVEYSVNRISFDDEITYTVFVKDITLHKVHRDALEYQANYDQLTGLPNRESLFRRIDEIRESYQRDGDGCVLVLLNLNGMQQVNDVMGHDTGDNVLRTVANRLQTICSDSTTCASIGGDEFAILYAGQGALADIHHLATSLDSLISESFVIDGLSMTASASMGVARYPQHADTPNGMLIAADVAMREASKANRAYMEYQSHFVSHTHYNLQLASDLSQAITDRQFIFHYQPKISLATGKLHSFEALVRWKHPRLGMISPDRFIPMTERSSHIRPFTMMAIEMAMQQYRANAHDGIEAPIAVNMSVSVLEDASFIDDLLELLYKYDLPVSAIELEITETAAIYDHGNILHVMRSLKARGFSLSIDDFGSGNASISYLKELPASELKIDRDYITDIVDSRSDRLITEAVTELAHKLGMRVVAEGIEDAETFHLLGRIGCDLAQGYWISKPLPATEIADWCRNWKLDKSMQLSVVKA